MSPALAGGFFCTEPPKQPVWHKLPRFLENWPQRNGTKLIRNRRLNVPRTTNMTLVSPLMTNLKRTGRADCVGFAWSPLPLSTITLTLRLSNSGSQTLDRQHTYPRIAGVQNKPNFFSPIRPLFGFWVASSWTPLFVTICSTFLWFCYFKTVI